MKQPLKATAAVIGIVAACGGFILALRAIAWICYYAGFTM